MSGRRKHEGDGIHRVVPKVEGPILTEDAHGGGSQLELLRRRDRESQPAGPEDTKKVTVGDDGAIAVEEAESGDHAIDPRHDLFRGISTGTAMEKQVPIGNEFPDFDRPQPLILAVVPLPQFGINESLAIQPRQPTGLTGTTTGAAPDLIKADSIQLRSQLTGLSFPDGRQRKVRMTGVTSQT